MKLYVTSLIYFLKIIFKYYYTVNWVMELNKCLDTLFWVPFINHCLNVPTCFWWEELH